MSIKTHQHFKLFKPYGMLSQFASNSTQQRNKRYLGELGSFPNGTMPIGRLDEASEGLLLLTTDGKMSYFVNNGQVEKEYYAQVDGIITSKAIKDLKNGVEIGFEGKKYITKPCRAALLKNEPNLPNRAKKIRDDRHGPTSWISLIITEGKFRQVRKMTSAVGFPTLRLVRVRVGNIMIDSLDAGAVEAINLSQDLIDL